MLSKISASSSGAAACNRLAPCKFGRFLTDEQRNQNDDGDGDAEKVQQY